MDLAVVDGTTMDQEPTSPLIEHLKEIKSRLLKCVIVVILTTIFSFYYASEVFDFFKSIVPDQEFFYMEVTELFGVYMKVSLYCGIALALPFLIYQLIRFAAPGLKNNEKKYLYLLIPFITVMFVIGAYFAYRFLLPPALEWLINPPFIPDDTATPNIRIGNYIGLVAKLLFWIGLMFETPLVMGFLARIGVVRASAFAKQGRIAIVGAIILAAIITPTFDPLNQTLVGGCIVALYAFGVVLAWILQGKPKESTEVLDMPLEENQT
jgi:sec-independent protein translocase protein TatC